jgi:hypothetical protein
MVANELNPCSSSETDASTRRGLNLVTGHFDAGVHLGEFIERDVIA